MKNFIFTILLSGTFLISNAQEGHALYLGLQPSFRTLNYYNQGQYDLNVVPLVAQFSLTRELDLRVTTIADLHFPNENPGFANLGAEIALPIAVNEKMARDIESEGLYVAPVYMYFKNKPTNTNYHTFAIEPGYMQVYGHHFGITFGLQLGAEYQDFENEKDVWDSYIAFKLVFGYWFRKDVVLGI